ncbi:MAG: hypothetical protein GF387_00665 [Candidatus Portnoybacteria bacterium]|nr:hypothetical protein [Candidatus Portnoybacteria bacterium]
MKNFFKSLRTIDGISQIGIFIFGVTALFLIAYKIKWGFVFGLLSQPFFFIAAIRKRQWGIFALCIPYTINWILGIINWF